MSNDVSYFKLLDDDTEFAFNDSDAEDRITTNTGKIGTLSSLTTTAKGNLVAAINELDSDKAETSNPSMTWAIGTDGSANLRRAGEAGNYTLCIYTKSDSSATGVYNYLILANGKRNWTLAGIGTKALTNQTTNASGNINTGLTTDSAAVLGSTVTSSGAYVGIPFVSNNTWYINFRDHTGARLASTSIGSVTVYYLSC